MRPLILTALMGLLSVPLSAKPVKQVSGQEVTTALRTVLHNQGRDFCQSDAPCREGMEHALNATNAYFVRKGKKIKTSEGEVRTLLREGASQAEPACTAHYASRSRRQRCRNGAKAGISLVATELGINGAPPLTLQIVQGQAYAGYEQYNACLTTCASQTPPPPKGCDVHCRDAFDLDAFLKSLPQVK